MWKLLVILVVMKLYARNDIFVNELFWLQEIKITIKKKKNEIKKKKQFTYSNRISKNEYFESFSEKNRHDTILIWKGSRQFVIRKPNNKLYPNIIKSKYKNITNPANTANALTIYLVCQKAF